MANSRTPGPQGVPRALGIQDGTLALARSPVPGVTDVARRAVGGWSRTDVLLEVIHRTMKLVPGQVAGKLADLTTPTSLSFLAGSLVLWVAAHAFGPGEVMDLLVLGAAMLFLGHEAFDFGQHMALFVSKTLHATDERDLDDAAHHLASAIAIVGIDILLVMLTRGGTKAWNNRYRPTIKADPTMPAGEGLTFKYGDIEYSSAGTQTQQQLALYHEMVHSFLSPKLRAFRTLRANLGMFGYRKSEFLRYLEEALAESYAQLRVHGIKGLPVGIRFPVVNGYVRLGGVVKEAVIAAGAVVVLIGGLRYVVSLEES